MKNKLKPVDHLNLNQMSLATGIMKLVSDQAHHQGVEFYACSRHYNAMISAATTIVVQCAKPPVMTTPNMGLHAWLNSDDVGASSGFMAYVLSNGPVVDNNHPRDNSDFGRCHRFLLAVPEAREKLQLMADHGQAWKNLAADWDKLTALYVADPQSKELYTLISECIK